MCSLFPKVIVLTFLFLLSIYSSSTMRIISVSHSLSTFQFLYFNSLFFPHLPPLAFSFEHPTPPFRPHWIAYFLILLSNCLYLPVTRNDFSFKIEWNRKSFAFQTVFYYRYKEPWVIVSSSKTYGCVGGLMANNMVNVYPFTPHLKLLYTPERSPM